MTEVNKKVSHETEVFRVGSRKSELALIQTNCVIERLKIEFPNNEYEIVTMSTTGDEILDKPLPKIGEKSLFTKELEVSMAFGSLDMVVHSLKDLPTSLPVGLAIGAILEREDPSDCLLLHSKHRGLDIRSLPTNSVIGTSSLRRTAQLKRNFPNLIVKDVRGNLQTRLRKLDSGGYDGLILAVAGVQRMGWEHKISQILNEDDMMYAVGQGALAVECRVQDAHLFAPLNHYDTVYRCVAERSLLSTLGGGCSAPVAVVSSFDSKTGTLNLSSSVWSLNGSVTEESSSSVNLIDGTAVQSTLTVSDNRLDDNINDLLCGFPKNCLNSERVYLSYKLGTEVAQKLIDKGALKIIEEAKEMVRGSS